MSWDAVDGAESYLIHYGNANQSDPKEATMMGYSESNNWKLAKENVPVFNEGDDIYFYVQTYREKGIGDNEVEKAKYLHDGNYLGSAWSSAVVITK